MGRPLPAPLSSPISMRAPNKAQTLIWSLSVGSPYPQSSFMATDRWPHGQLRVISIPRLNQTQAMALARFAWELIDNPRAQHVRHLPDLSDDLVVLLDAASVVAFDLRHCLRRGEVQMLVHH